MLSFIEKEIRFAENDVADLGRTILSGKFKTAFLKGKDIFNPALIMAVMEQNNIEEIRKKAERFESQYNKLKQEFKDYVETSRRNEEMKRQELKIDAAKKLMVMADSLSRVSVAYDNVSCDIVKSYSENLKKNMDAIYSQLLSVSGLTQVEPSAGDKFDDKMHIAIGLEYGTAYPENSVFRVIRKGYRIENNIVRPAEVIVSKRPVEVTKVTKPGLWDRILRWISPAKQRFTDINQRIDEFERVQKEDVGKLTQDIAALKNMIMELEARNQKAYELDRIQKEKTEKLTQDISYLRKIIIELEENITLEEQAPLKGSDVSDNAGRENEAFKSDSY